MASLRRLTPVAAAAAAACVLAVPASAGVSVTLTGSGGTREFSVEDMAGGDLTSLDLGTGSSKSFRVHVKDTGFLAGAGQAGYTVSATMSNLYLQTGDPQNPTYNYAVKVPSSELSIAFPSNPLSISGLSLQDLPKVNLTGLVAGCSDPVTGLLSLVNSLGLNISSLLSLSQNTKNALTALCNQVGVAGAPLTTTVDATLQTLTGLVPPSLLDAPTQLGGASGGTFTNPAYGTVGSGDTKPAGALDATPVTLMTGKPNLTAGLSSLITSALTSATAGLPLLSGTGSALTTVDALTKKLADPTTGAVANALQQLVSTLPLSDQISVLDKVFDAAGIATPSLLDIRGVTGDYYSVPKLQATPRTPVPGTYGGTMTVTFVQS